MEQYYDQEILRAGLKEYMTKYPQSIWQLSKRLDISFHTLRDFMDGNTRKSSFKTVLKIASLLHEHGFDIGRSKKN